MRMAQNVLWNLTHIYTQEKWCNSFYFLLWAMVKKFDSHCTYLESQWTTEAVSYSSSPLKNLPQDLAQALYT